MDYIVQIVMPVVTVGSALAGVWIGNHFAEKRHRLEIDNRDKQQRAELRARFVDSLLAPRIDAHQAVLAAMLDLQTASHYHLTAPNDEHRQEFLRARDAFRISCGLQRVWLRTPALEQLGVIDAALNDQNLARADSDALKKEFAAAEARLHWSLGTEQLEFYMRKLWETELGTPR